MSKNWKTTLVGYLMAAASVFGQMADARAHGGPAITWQSGGIAAMAILLGHVSKDSDMTGGTRVQ